MQEPGAEEVSAALARALSRPEFAERELPGPLQLLVEWWTALQQWLLDLLPGSLSLGPLGTFLVRVTVIVLLLVLVVAVGRLLARDAMRRLADRRERRHDGSAAGAEEGPGNAAAWEERARSAAAAGRLREAALALHQAVALRLQDRGLVRVQAGKTPGDYRREVSADPRAAGAFERFVRLLLPLAFGARSPDAAGLERLWRAAEEVTSDG